MARPAVGIQAGPVTRPGSLARRKPLMWLVRRFGLHVLAIALGIVLMLIGIWRRTRYHRRRMRG
jgi:hypothetical protein